MSYALSRPDESAVREALGRVRPDLVDAPIETLGQGWAFWAYQAGDTVLRFPQDGEGLETLEAEAAVMLELAPRLPLPVAAITVHPQGPNGLPFTAHQFVPGQSIVDLPRALAPNSGTALGAFLRSMHGFPTDVAVSLGMRYVGPQQQKAELETLLADAKQRMFPLTTPEASAQVVARFESYLHEAAHFAWEPVLSHGDLDDWNVLADPGTGELTGVIDWGDVRVGDPALDFTTAMFGGFAARGMRLTDIASAYGINDVELNATRSRCAFYAFCWPLHEISFGLESQQDDIVQRGIDFLYRTIASGL